MELNFSVQNQKIKYNSNLYIVEKSRNYLTAKFSFSGSEWKNVAKTAIFRKGELVYNVLIDESGRCNIPSSVITKGTLEVSVFGGDLITTDTATVKILKSGYEEGEAPSEPPPDVYAQILAELQNIRDNAITEEQIGQAVEAYLDKNVVEALSPEDVEKIVYDYMDEHKDELKGEKGEPGYTPQKGIDYNDGKNGENGKDGKSAYQIAVDNGFKGTEAEWLESLKCPPDGLVPDSRTIGGLDLTDDITADELINALGIENLQTDIKQTDSHTLSNSYAGGVKLNELGGVSEQGTTTGKNILRFPYAQDSKTENGGTFTVNEDGSVTVNGTFTEETYFLFKSRTVGIYEFEPGTYILNGCPKGGGDNSYRIKCNKTVNGSAVGEGNDYGDGVTINITEEDTPYSVYISIPEGMTVNNLVFKPMISIVGGEYEPYTGNAPSPSPDYPQEIESVVLSEIKTNSANFFDSNNLYKNNGVTYQVNGNEITVTGINGYDSVTGIIKGLNGKTVTFSSQIVSKTNSNATVHAFLRVTYADGTMSYHGTGATVSIPKDAKEIVVQLVVNNTETALSTANTAVFRNTRVVLNGEDWTEYNNSSLALSSPITLNGIGDVKDRIVRKDGVWGVERKFAEIVFDGSDDEKWITNTINDGTSYRLRTDVTIGTFKPTDIHTLANVLCDSLVVETAINTYNGMQGFSVDNYGGIIIYDTTFNTSDVSLWKEHLQDNPMKVVYELAEEVFEPLPTADQIALNSLLSFDTVTYLSCDSEIEPTWDVEYGTSKVGAYTLDAWNKAENNKIQVASLTALTNSLATALVAGSEG